MQTAPPVAEQPGETEVARQAGTAVGAQVGVTGGIVEIAW